MWRRLVGFVDWRFLVALTVLVLVVAVAQSARTEHQQNERLVEQAERNNRIWNAEREASANERRELLHGQRDLAHKYERLITWLNAQNITVPETVLVGGVRYETGNDDDDDGSDEGSGKQSSPKSGDATGTVGHPGDVRSDEFTGFGGQSEGRSTGHGRGLDRDFGRSAQ